MAQQLRGTNVMNERGFYVVDTLRLVIAVSDVGRLIPSMLTNPNQHIKDRIVFQNEVFVPTRVLPRGRYGSNYSVITIDCNLVNSEELVNDSQFQPFVDVVFPYVNQPTNTGSIATPVSSPVYDAPNNLLDGGMPTTEY
jgi:hypothetical protein